MNYYRINVNVSYDRSFEKYEIVTCPVKSHPGHTTVGNVRKGDLVFICKGLFCPLRAVAIAEEDAYQGNVEFYENAPRLVASAVYTLKLRVLTYLDGWISLERIEHCLLSPSHKSPNFCVQLYPIPDKTSEMREIINGIMGRAVAREAEKATLVGQETRGTNDKEGAA